MVGIWRDFLISFCPDRPRQDLRPESTDVVLRWATWGGLAQFLALSFLLWLRYKSFFIARSHEWAPVIGGSIERVQVTAFIIATLEFLIHPASILLLYFMLEGLTRFVAGFVSAQVVPALPVFLAFRLKDALQQRRQAERIASLPPDTIEFLHEKRVRIASARFRPQWNASLTIGIRGELHEIESKEPGMPGRPFVFVLKPATVGRALRGYEEYDPASATIINQEPPAAAAASPDLPAAAGPVEN
jgi:hypothetical protein